MWLRGVLTGVGIAVLGWVWLQTQAGMKIPRSTTLQLVDAHPDVTQTTVAAYIRQIEAGAPWILKINEKSSTK